MAETVYVLSALTSTVCAGLLLRGWLASRVALLFWCFVCFTGLALNNVVLFVDKVVAPDIDLSAWRGLPAAVGVAALAFSLAWGTKR